MHSRRARIWASLLTVVVGVSVAWNVRDLPRTSWPAPGPLATSCAGSEVSVSRTGDIATLHIRAADEVLYGMGFDLDEWTAGRWVNRYVGIIFGDDVIEPFRPRDDMFWPASAGFGATHVRVAVSRLDAGTYRLRKGFFTGSDATLETFELAATFTVT